MSGEGRNTHEKNASLSLKLKADNGYRSNSDGYRVSVDQWAAIVAICEDTPLGVTHMAAPDLLEALETAVKWLAISDDPRCTKDLQAAEAAILKATGGQG